MSSPPLTERSLLNVFSMYVTGTYRYCCPHFLKSFMVFFEKINIFLFISIVNCFIYTFYISVKFLTITLAMWNEIENLVNTYLNQTRANILTWHSNKFSVIDCPIQTSGAFYYFVYCSTSILECQSKDLCWIFFIFVSFCLSNHSIYLGAVVAKAKVH